MPVSGEIVASGSNYSKFLSSVYPFPPPFVVLTLIWIYISSSGLSSELQVDIDTQDLYLKFDRNSFKPASLNRSFVELAFNDKEVHVNSLLSNNY